MTNKMKVLQQIATDSRCGVCGVLEEDLDRILRTCPTASYFGENSRVK